MTVGDSGFHELSPEASKRFRELLSSLDADIRHPEVSEDLWNFLMDVWALRLQTGLLSAFSYKGVPLDDGWFRFEVDVAGASRTYDASPLVSVAVERALKHIGDGDFLE